MKKTLTGIALLLLLLTTIWLARNSLLMSLANLYLKPTTIELQCVDFHLNGLSKVVLHELCVSLPQADITLQQAVWDLSAKSLNIDSITVVHQRQHNATPGKLTDALEWQIPDLPAIDINRIRLSSPLLKTPVTLSAEYRQPQLSLRGPVRLEATLKQNLLSGTLTWRRSDLTSVVNLPERLDKILDNNPIQTSWTFDGQTLKSQHQLSIAGSAKLTRSDSTSCPLQFKLYGRLGFNADILSQNAILDLSALPVHLSAEDCPSYFPASLAPWQPKRLTIHLPEPARVNLEGITVPKVRLNSESPLTTVEFKDVTSDFNDLSMTYLLSMDSESAHFEGTGNLSVDNINTLSASALAGNITFDANNHLLRLNQLQYDDVQLVDTRAQLNASYSPAEGLNTELSVTTGSVTQAMFKGEKLQLKVNLTSADLKHLQGSINASTDSVSMKHAEFQEMEHQSQISYDGKVLTLKGKSAVRKGVLQGVKLNQPKLVHQLQLPLPRAQFAFVPDNLTSTHTLTLASGFNAQLKQKQQRLDIEIPVQPLNLLNTPIQTRFPHVIIGGGQISANLSHQIDTQHTEVLVNIDDVDLAYAKYLAQKINLNLNASRDSGQLHIQPTTLSINTVQTGVDIHNIKAQIATEKGNIIVKDMQGQLFDGQFQLDKLAITDAPQSSLLSLSNLDMARILELQQETGIDVQGRVSGNIPLHIEQRQVEVRNGNLFNLNQGKLQIKDNAAFSALKQSQPQLEPVLSLLQNLEFTELNSDVSMQPDGLLFLDMQIKGRNPDEKQDVNFNYTHEENIYTLLRALRLGEEIQDKLEQNIQ